MKKREMSGIDDSEFRPLSIWREWSLPKDSLQKYYINKRAFLYSNDRNKLTTFKLQAFFHRFLMSLFSLNRIFIDKQKYSILRDERRTSDNNVIFAITHIGKFDYQIITEALKVHTIPFAGDPELTYRSFDGMVFNANGRVFIDTEDKADRKVAYKTAVEVIKNGYNLMIFPEGIWNISSNKLVQPLFPGVIKMAIETGKSIVPVAIEQYGKDFFIIIGKNIDVLNRFDDKYIDDQRILLRDCLATLKYELIERCGGSIKRADMEAFDIEDEKFVQRRLMEYCNPHTKKPYFSREFIRNRLYREN